MHVSKGIVPDRVDHCVEFHRVRQIVKAAHTPTGRIDAVGEENYCLSPVDRFEAIVDDQIDGFVKACAGRYFGGFDGAVDLFSVACRPAKDVDLGIERHNHHLVLRPKLSDKRDRRRLYLGDLERCRIAHIEHESNGKRCKLIREKLDLLLDAVRVLRCVDELGGPGTDTDGVEQGILAGP